MELTVRHPIALHTFVTQESERVTAQTAITPVASAPMKPTWTISPSMTKRECEEEGSRGFQLRHFESISGAENEQAATTGAKAIVNSERLTRMALS